MDGKERGRMPDSQNRINGKVIIWLGSSVTYGAASDGYSMVDAIGEYYNCICVKEAVSGTTLVDNGEKSYVQRMFSIDKELPADHFICQLSTNDATQKKPLGEIADSFDKEGFDTSTIAGAIEYIIAYAKETWDCPVSFYTGTKYESDEYEAMVELLYKIRDKWGIGIIDLYSDADMNSVSADNYKEYMADPIHPNLKGYTEWWTPKFVEYLEERN